MVLKKYTISSLVTLFALMPFSSTSLAQNENDSNRSDSNSEEQLRFQLPDIPPGLGVPTGRESGGGSRGDCPLKPNLPPLTALIPENSIKLTVSQYPTVWVYVPYAPEEVTYGKLSLQDEAGKEFWRVHFKLPATPGVIGIQFPSTNDPLTLNQTYQWYFELSCPNPESLSSNKAIVMGKIQRINMSQLNTNQNVSFDGNNTLWEKAIAFSRYGIWYDAVDTLARLQLTNPENSTVNRAWHRLLKDDRVILDEVVDEPIVGNVTITNSPPE